MQQTGIDGTTIHIHHGYRPRLCAELQRQTGQREYQKAGDNQDVQEDVNPVEATILFVSIGNDVVMSSRRQQIGLLAVLDKTAEHPEQGMNPEYRKGGEQQSGHGNEGVKQDRVFVTIRHLTV